MWTRARDRAKKRGLPFDIAIADVIIPNFCPVFGTELIIGGPVNTRPSLDRIHDNLGYVKGNIIVVSFRANALKSNLTLEELNRLADFYNQFDW